MFVMKHSFGSDTAVEATAVAGTVAVSSWYTGTAAVTWDKVGSSHYGSTT